MSQLILQALAVGPRDSAELLRALSDRASLPNHWDPNALDAILRRLMQRGFVEAHWELRGGAGGRRYHLTRLGEQRLALAPPDPDGSLAAESEWVTRSLVDSYGVIRPLGRGATGAVYLALDRVLQRYVAVKVLQRQLAQDPAMRERFLREARTNAGLAHPAIVPVFGMVASADLVFFVMQYVPGDSLGALLRERGKLPAQEACRILAELAGALDYAHRQRVVHRDVKPENILIHRDTGMPMLTDFGVARAISFDAMHTSEQKAERELFWGTPHFMSPEQISGEDNLDGRSDLYALGALGYTMLTGRPPFEGHGPVEIAARQLTMTPPALGELAPESPEALVHAITRCLARNPGDRWQDGRSLREALIGAGVLA
ncbi:MAG TPA: protein kinase, partial [Gemmatimonadales bacterium]|nr:protein kinase [Gemmatimonadales bacterium]